MTLVTTHVDPTPTQAALMKMLKQPTGTSILDSGGVSGRHWQQNQGRGFLDEEKVTARWEHDYMNVTFNIFWYLDAHLESDPNWDRFCEKAEEVMGEDYDLWEFTYTLTNIMLKAQQVEEDKFIDALTVAYSILLHPDQLKEAYRTRDQARKHHYYTYNMENCLSQDFQAAEITLESGEYVVLMIHNGCDARGGFTEPRIFKVRGEGNLFYDARDYTLGCDRGHMWDTNDAGYSFHPEHQRDMSRASDWWKNLFRKGLKEFNLIATEDGNVHCPICHLRNRTDKFLSAWVMWE